MSNSLYSSGFLGRALALTVVLSAGATVMAAQANNGPTETAATSARPTLNLTVPTADTALEPTFSSSAAENEVAVNVNHFDFVDAMQYGGGRRSGRPRYRGSNTNADGSNKYDFFAGAGFTQPTGNTYHYLTPSYSFQVGGGRQYNKNFAMNLQFDWDNFGFNGRTLGNQLNLYNELITIYNNTATGAANPAQTLASLDGSSHVWSFTLDPTYTFYSGEGLGAYVVGGVGFYHKVATFTTPEVGEAEDYYGDIFEYETNGTVDHYTSNSIGVDGGFGLTYKFSRFSNERLYGEVRYVYIPNSQRQGLTINSPLTTASLNVANDYPANSNRTTYIPVKFGIRF